MIVDWYIANRTYTIPATLGFLCDLYFKWHSILIDIIKYYFSKNDTKKSNYILYKEGLRQQRQQILNEPFYIWGYNNYENSEELYKECYVKNISIKNLGKKHKKNRVFFKKKCGIAILGKAGVGKSTYLRHAFLKSTNKAHHVINILFNRRFYFYVAKDMIKRPEIKTYLQNDRRNAKSKFIFIDGLDEVSENDFEKIAVLANEIYNMGYTLIISCRKDIYEYMRLSDLSIFSIINIHLEIGEWSMKQSKEYISKYTKLYSESNIDQLIQSYLENPQYATFFQTPLELSMLIYILEQSIDSADKKNIVINRYDLYNKFLHIWIQREVIRKESAHIKQDANIDDIMDLWTSIAFMLTKNNRILYTNDIRLKNGVQKNSKLLKYMVGMVKLDNKNNRNCIVGFNHETIKEFLVARFFFNSIGACSENMIDAILWEYNYSVTSFIQENLFLLDHETRVLYFNNLVGILANTNPYKKSKKFAKYRPLLNGKMKNMINRMSLANQQTLKNQIIYFAARIPDIDQKLVAEGNDVIEEVYLYDDNVFNRRSAAIGATILGNTKVELLYAQELLNDYNSNLRDRSFTMVYYQDVKEVSPFEYIDDGIHSWDNSRKSRINRLKTDTSKNIRMRTFDLITIYNFTVSRNGTFIPSEEELETVKNCNINLSVYTDEKKALLNIVKNNIISEWERAMNKRFCR